MVKLADLVHIANNAKTDAQKNAVGEELKKMVRGKKACSPKQELFSNTNLKIEKGKNLRKLGEGQYGAVFYGCLEDKCATKVAIKVTNEPSARMEYRIAEKLRSMGVPRMYHFKSCGDEKDILYFEYVKGEQLSKWMSRNQTSDDYRELISRLIGNLKKIHEKYPKFRHHDLHWNNVMVMKGNIPIMIDFGMSMIEGVRNPVVSNGDFTNAGISTKSHYMYDAHYILNIIHSFTKNQQVRKFIENLFPMRYLKHKSDVVSQSRLRLMKHKGLPTYDDILEHPFFKKPIVVLPKKVVAVPKPKPTAKPKVKTASAIRRAKAILEKEAAMKARPPKRPGVAVAKRNPTVKQQVQEIENRIKPKTPVVQRPKIFMNKNGDLKIEKRKCRLYKKEELAKMFKLDPKLTKEQMCKFIKNM